MEFTTTMDQTAISGAIIDHIEQAFGEKPKKVTVKLTGDSGLGSLEALVVVTSQDEDEDEDEDDYDDGHKDGWNSCLKDTLRGVKGFPVLGLDLHVATAITALIQKCVAEGKDGTTLHAAIAKLEEAKQYVDPERAAEVERIMTDGQ